MTEESTSVSESTESGPGAERAAWRNRENGLLRANRNPGREARGSIDPGGISGE